MKKDIVIMILILIVILGLVDFTHSQALASVNITEPKIIQLHTPDGIFNINILTITPEQKEQLNISDDFINSFKKPTVKDRLDYLEQEIIKLKEVK